MSRALRIAVADDDAVMRQYYQTILPLLGHEVVAVAKNGRELVEGSTAARPDLIITDIKMGEIDGIDAAAQVCQQFPLPVILVSAHHEAELLARASHEHMLAYLVKPVKQADLETAIAIALQRFEQFRNLRREAATLRQALEDRKLIERAKYVLVERVGLSEPEALQRLQKLASDKNRKLAEVAQMILLVEDALLPPSAE
jgi:two-component system, response regulator PdtaR